MGTKLYTDKQMRDWHDEVCQRDNHVCNGCGRDFSADAFFDNETGRNQRVCGDHVKTKGSAPSLILDPNNGRCVCHDCHGLITDGMEIEEAGMVVRNRLEKRQEKLQGDQLSAAIKTPPKTGKKLEKFWGNSAKPWQGTKKGQKRSKKKISIKITKVYNRHTGKIETIK